jgi:hypothetical protein
MRLELSPDDARVLENVLEEAIGARQEFQLADSDVLKLELLLERITKPIVGRVREAA